MLTESEGKKNLVCWAYDVVSTEAEGSSIGPNRCSAQLSKRGAGKGMIRSVMEAQKCVLLKQWLLNCELLPIPAADI